MTMSMSARWSKLAPVALVGAAVDAKRVDDHRSASTSIDEVVARTLDAVPKASMRVDATRNIDDIQQYGRDRIQQVDTHQNQLDAGRKYRTAMDHDDRAGMDYQQGRIDTLHAVLDAIAAQP